MSAVELEKKTVHVLDEKKSSITPFSFHLVKKYLDPDVFSVQFVTEPQTHFSSVSTSSIIVPKDDYHINSHLTEVLTKQDPRVPSPKMKDAIEKEKRGLIEAGIFKVILRADVSQMLTYCLGGLP